MMKVFGFVLVLLTTIAILGIAYGQFNFCSDNKNNSNSSSCNDNITATKVLLIIYCLLFGIYILANFMYLWIVKREAITPNFQLALLFQLEQQEIFTSNVMYKFCNGFWIGALIPIFLLLSLVFFMVDLGKQTNLRSRKSAANQKQIEDKKKKQNVVQNKVTSSDSNNQVGEEI